MGVQIYIRISFCNNFFEKKIEKIMLPKNEIKLMFDFQKIVSKSFANHDSFVDVASINLFF